MIQWINLLTAFCPLLSSLTLVSPRNIVASPQLRHLLTNKRVDSGLCLCRKSPCGRIQEMSCEAATRAKPRARLCEPWVQGAQEFPEPRSGAQSHADDI